MTLTIIKIVLIILMIRVIILTIGHLVTVFWDHATKMAIEQITKDPEDYVKTDHICKFMYNITIVRICSDKCHCSFWIFVTRYK